MARTPRGPKQVASLNHEADARRNIATAELADIQRMLEEQAPQPPAVYPRARPLANGETRERDADLDPQIIWNGARITLTKDQAAQLAQSGTVEIGDAQLVWRGKDQLLRRRGDEGVRGLGMAAPELAEFLEKAEKRFMTQVLVVKAAFDPEAGVWFTESGDVHGLRIEAATLDAFVERIPGAVQDLLEGDDPTDGFDIPIEVIAHASTRVRIPERVRSASRHV